MLKIKTSVEILIDYASERWQGKEDRNSKRNLAIIYDLYAKAASYSVLNKFAFIFSIIFTVAVLIVPIVSIFLKTGSDAVAKDYSAFQTAATGLAAISVALYNHYKKRQLYVENFMRHILYLKEITDDVVKKILKEIERLDAGFNFSSPNNNNASPIEEPESEDGSPDHKAHKTPSIESGSGK